MRRPGLVPVQNIFVRVMLFLGYVYDDATFIERCRQIPPLSWYNDWCGRLYGMVEEMILELDTSAQVIELKKSSIPHTDFRFFSLTIVEENVVVYYNRSVVYAVLNKKTTKTMT